MLPHKVIDNFISEYNLIFKLRGYSKMNVAQKNKMMEQKVKAVHDSTIKTEWNRLNKIQDKKMKRLDVKSSMVSDENDADKKCQGKTVWGYRRQKSQYRTRNNINC